MRQVIKPFWYHIGAMRGYQMKNIYAGQEALGVFYALPEYMLMRVIRLRLTQLTLDLLKGQE